MYIMIQKLDLPVSVLLSFDHKKRISVPKKLLFEGREHLISKVGLHHTFRDGRVLYHVFSVANDTMFFRLVLNTETLGWTLTEVADEETN